VIAVHPSYFGTAKDQGARKAALDQSQPEPAKASSAAAERTPFGTKTEKGRVIWVFRNGDKYHEGVRMVIHPRKYRKMEQVYDEMNIKPGVVTGSVRKVYTPTGALVQSVDEFEDGGAYICSGGDSIKKDFFSEALLKKHHEFEQTKTETEQE